MSNTVPSPVGGRRQANFREKILLGGAGGVNALQISSDGGNSTGAEFFDFCGTRAGQRWIFELPGENDRRGSWRAGRPPDLPAREKAEVG